MIRTVVSGILLSADQHLRVEELAVRTSSDLVNWLLYLVSQESNGIVLTATVRTEGSRSTKMERGTYLLSLVSVKKVSKEPGSPISVASGSRRPSAFKPCSRRYLNASLVSLLHSMHAEPSLHRPLLSLSRRAGVVFFFSAQFPNREGVTKGGEPTTPKHCYRAECQPGRCEDGRPN